MKKKIAAAGLAAGLVAGTAAGFVLEMSGNAGASGKASAVAPVAGDTSGTSSVNGTQTPPDISARLQEILQPLVDDSTLTQDQADKVIAALEAAGPIGGGRGDHGPRGMQLETVATTLGMTADEVRTAISGGQTLAQLAESKGKTAQDLIDALIAQLTAHLDEEVASGEHTQEEADARLAEATTRITDFVNNTPQLPADGGMGGHHGPDGGAPDQSGTNTTGTGGVIDAGPTDSTQG